MMKAMLAIVGPAPGLPCPQAEGRGPMIKRQAGKRSIGTGGGQSVSCVGMDVIERRPFAFSLSKKASYQGGCGHACALSGLVSAQKVSLHATWPGWI